MEYGYVFAALTLVIAAAGFFRLVYFVSIGYAFSMAAMAAAGILLYRGAPSVLSWGHAGLLFLYGLRLGSYLVIREGRAAYAREQGEIRDRDRRVGFWKRGAIWLGVSVLYLCMFTPAASSLARQASLAAEGGGPVLPAAGAAGLALMVLGLGLEAAADGQKSAFKKRHPADFCSVGLYRMVRCPNYLGELIFWTGNLLAGVYALTSWYLWPPALLGYLCIILIMLGSTKRLEEKQGRRYGDREDYRAYIRRVPVILPLVPLYSLKNLRVFLE